MRWNTTEIGDETSVGGLPQSKGVLEEGAGVSPTDHSAQRAATACTTVYASLVPDGLPALCDGGAFDAAVVVMKARREAAIDALVATAARKGDGTHEGKGSKSRLYWSIVYDMEHAPTTTNRAQLLLLGVEVPPLGSLTDAELPARILAIAQGWARWGVFVQCTDHLSDRELYERLSTRVLDEEVAELPPECGATEHIDFAVDASSDALDWYADDDEESSAPSGMVDRDRLLPTPREFNNGINSVVPQSQEDIV